MRLKRSVQNGVTYEYLQSVRADRAGTQVCQQVLATLGSRAALTAAGERDGLLHSLGRFSQQLRVVEAVRVGGLRARTSRVWGPALVFGRLWERQGVGAILKSLAEKRRLGFEVERVSWALALQRLSAPGSDLQGSQWIHTGECPGWTGLALQHFYRTAGFLAEVRDELEPRLFARDRDLFRQELDVVFIATTSVLVYRDTETAYRKRGYSRDRRPDRRPRWPKRTRVWGVSRGRSGRTNPRWRFDRSTTLATTRRSGTSWRASWPCGWRSTCSTDGRHVGWRCRGRTCCVTCRRCRR